MAGDPRVNQMQFPHVRALFQNGVGRSPTEILEAVEEQRSQRPVGFKIAIKIFYCYRKGKKGGRRKGGREAESWKEGERERVFGSPTHNVWPRGK